MPRQAAPYVLIKRKNKKGRVTYYVRFKGEAVKHCAGTNRVDLAHQWAQGQLRLRVFSQATLGDYILNKGYYVWGQCPHLQRMLASDPNGVGKRHAHDRKREIDTRIIPDEISKQKLVDLVPGDVEDFKGRLLAKASPRVTNKALGTLKTILNEAAHRGDMPKRITDGIRQVAEPEAKKGLVPLTEEEVAKLYKVEAENWPAAWERIGCLLLVDAALRKQELIALQWKHVDFGAGMLRLRRAWKDYEEGMKDQLKWDRKHRGRDVPLRPRLKDALEEWHRACEGSPEDCVLTNADSGRYFSPESALRWFRAGMKLIDVNWAARGLTPHRCRDSFVTRALQAGLSHEVVRKMVGHTEQSTTDLYTHFEDKYLVDQMRRLDPRPKRKRSGAKAEPAEG